MSTFTLADLEKTVENIEEQYGKITQHSLYCGSDIPGDQVLILTCVEKKHQLYCAPEKMKDLLWSFPRSTQSTLEYLTGIPFVGRDYFLRFIEGISRGKCFFCSPEGLPLSQHQCQAKIYCTCRQDRDEPYERCAIHGHIPTRPQCTTCGRFMKEKQ